MSRKEITKDTAATVYTYGNVELGVRVYFNGMTFTLEGVASSPDEVRKALRELMPKDLQDTIPGIMVGLYFEAAKLAKEQGWGEAYKLATNCAQQAYANSLN